MRTRTRCYEIGWNMAADDLHPLPEHALSALAEDVANQQFPRFSDEAGVFYHAQEFIRGYKDQWAMRHAPRGVARRAVS